MIKLYDNGVYLLNGTDIVEDNGQAEAQIQAKCGEVPSKEQASEGTIAYSILPESVLLVVWIIFRLNLTS